MRIVLPSFGKGIYAIRKEFAPKGSKTVVRSKHALKAGLKLLNSEYLPKTVDPC